MTCSLLLGTRVLWLGAAGLLAGLAQTPAPAAMPSPPMDALAYRSALADYQAYQDQPVQPWREANDEVGRIGGWRAYAREAAQALPAGAAGDLGAGAAGIAGDKPAPETGAMSAPSTAPLSAPASAADPHAGHHGGQP